MEEQTNMQQPYEPTELTIGFQKKAITFVKNNIYLLAIFAICVIYIVKGLTDIEKTGNSVVEIIGDSAINLIFSIILCRFLELNGLAKGCLTDGYKTAMDDYRAVLLASKEYTEYMDEWCERYSRERYMSDIEYMLIPLGIKAEAFIKGEYDESKLTKEQKAVLKKVRRYKIHRRTRWELTSGDLDVSRQKDYSKISKAHYVKHSAISDMFSKVFICCLLAYYTLPPIFSWNWSGIIWATLQTVIYLILGMMKYFNGFNFVNDQIREKVIDKTQIIELFIKEQKNDKRRIIQQETTTNSADERRPV